MDNSNKIEIMIKIILYNKGHIIIKFISNEYINTQVSRLLRCSHKCSINALQSSK